MNPIVVPGLPAPQAEKAARVIQAALVAADPRAAVMRALVSIGASQAGGATGSGVTGGAGGAIQAGSVTLDLAQYNRVRVIGAGKAAQAMAQGAAAVLGERITDGLLITKHIDPEAGLPGGIRVLAGGHPVPTADSLASARALVDFLRQGRPGDLVVCLISGGGSALMTAPPPGVTLEDYQALTRLLLACGADIFEINTLRKHLDLVKGGGLARLAAPARLITLILSDVIGSPLDVIASGPTVPDPSTYADALAICHKYQLIERLPAGIRTVLQRGASGELPETIKPGDPLLSGVTNLLVASNAQAAEAALQQAQAEGFHTLLLTTYLQGEAAQAGKALASILREVAVSGQPVPRPACLLAGGETTVTLRGDGAGGRNQELALGAAFLLDGLKGTALVTLGTDGEDGPTDAAGAIVSGETLSRARALGLDAHAYLQNNDSYHFFAGLGDLLITGPTGTNVNDLTFLFAF